jgi:hypothetical protein
MPQNMEMASIAFIVVVKKRSDCGTFFCYNTYAAILFSEHYYD